MTVSGGLITGTTGLLTAASVTHSSGTMAANLTTAGAYTLTGGTVSGNVTAASVAHSTGTMSGTLNTAGTYTLTSGTISGNVTSSGQLFAPPSGTVTGNLSGTAGVTKTTTGTVTLSGTNNYGGTTTISAGTLAFTKASALYNNTPGLWTPANIVVSSGATLGIRIGGAGEFTDPDFSTLGALPRAGAFDHQPVQFPRHADAGERGVGHQRQALAGTIIDDG